MDRATVTLDVNDLLARYADAVMRRDPGDWGACWAEDATWILDGHEVSGRTGIVATWQGAMAGFPLVIHTAFPPRIVITGDRVRSRCTVQETLCMADDTAFEVVGVYHDEFSFAAGCQFTRRRFDVLLSRPLDLSAAEISAWPTDIDSDFLA